MVVVERANIANVVLPLLTRSSDLAHAVHTRAKLLERNVVAQQCEELILQAHNTPEKTDSICRFAICQVLTHALVSPGASLVKSIPFLVKETVDKYAALCNDANALELTPMEVLGPLTKDTAYQSDRGDTPPQPYYTASTVAAVSSVLMTAVDGFAADNMTSFRDLTFVQACAEQVLAMSGVQVEDDSTEMEVMATAVHFSALCALASAKMTMYMAFHESNPVFVKLAMQRVIPIGCEQVREWKVYDASSQLVTKEDCINALVPAMMSVAVRSARHGMQAFLDAHIGEAGQQAVCDWAGAPEELQGGGIRMCLQAIGKAINETMKADLGNVEMRAIGGLSELFLLEERKDTRMQCLKMLIKRMLRTSMSPACLEEELQQQGQQGQGLEETSMAIENAALQGVNDGVPSGEPLLSFAVKKALVTKQLALDENIQQQIVQSAVADDGGLESQLQIAVEGLQSAIDNNKTRPLKADQQQGQQQGQQHLSHLSHLSHVHGDPNGDPNGDLNGDLNNNDLNNNDQNLKDTRKQEGKLDDNAGTADNAQSKKRQGDDDLEAINPDGSGKASSDGFLADSGDTATAFVLSAGAAFNTVGQMRVSMVGMIIGIIILAMSPVIFKNLFSSGGTSGEGFTSDPYAMQSMAAPTSTSTSTSKTDELRRVYHQMLDISPEELYMITYAMRRQGTCNALHSHLRTSVMSTAGGGLLILGLTALLNNITVGKDNNWWMTKDNALGSILFLYVGSSEMQAGWAALTASSQNDKMVDALARK